MFLDTPHKKKSAAITGVTAILLLLLFFTLGLHYMDPPISYGMEVNFGSSAVGRGKVQPQKPIASKPIPVKEKIETVEETSPTPPEPKEKKQSQVLTEKESTVAVNKKKETTQTEPFPTPKKEEVIEPEPEPTVSEATKKVLSNFINSQPKTGVDKAGSGNDSFSGDKGKLEGNPYATSYYDKSGPGGQGKGYGLNGRNLMSSGSKTQDCNEEGTVVVRIIVNRQGRVISAQPGVKGTTNSHPCLLAPARETAMFHQWFPDSKAPQKQVGFVVIQFKLTQ